MFIFQTEIKILHQLRIATHKKSCEANIFNVSYIRVLFWPYITQIRYTVCAGWRSCESHVSSMRNGGQLERWTCYGPVIHKGVANAQDDIGIKTQNNKLISNMWLYKYNKVRNLSKRSNRTSQNICTFLLFEWRYEWMSK